MADGDPLILGTNNNADSQTNLSSSLATSGIYGLHVQALDGHAVGGLSGVGIGIEGVSTSGTGVRGTSTNDDGVSGSSSKAAGVHGGSISGTGVLGTSFQGTAVEGFSFGLGAGVTGLAPFQTGPGVVGVSTNGFGVRGQSGAAVLLPPVGGAAEFLRCAVQGSSDEGTGVRGDSAHKVGVRGRSFSGDGVFGSCLNQPNGPATKGNGIHGSAPGPSPNATAGPFAGKFDGHVRISGHLYVGNTLIAHPLLINAPIVVASGVADLNSNGEAVVALPAQVAAMHMNFRYQLTAIGGPAPNLHIAQEIRAGKFRIAGGASRQKVSWQLGGELKARVAGKHEAEKPFDQQLAKKHKTHEKHLTQLVKKVQERARRRHKK